jgi:TPR repeat protein
MNNSNRIFQVGFCYYYRIRVEINKRKAFEHYLKSAKIDNSIRIFKTTICYYYRIGVEKSNSKFDE